MAGHLFAAGHDTLVWNRTPGKAHGLGIPVADSLSALAAACDVVCLCVGRSEDVEECVATMQPSLKTGALVVDHSTISPQAAQEIAASLAASGHRFVDAPVTGGSMGAKKGTLTIFCGGSEADVEAAMPYLQAYGRRVERVGESGKGQMMKLANQIAVGGALMALCETLGFAKKAGLDLVQAREMIGSGAGGSWAFENYGPMILHRNWTPGFSIKNQRKDFGYCREAAEQLGAQIPATDLVDRLLAFMESQGKGELTTAVLYEWYEGHA